MKWVEKLDLGDEHQFVIAELIDAWRQETKRIKRFAQELSTQATNDPLEKIYRSAPGVGAVSARMLSNELLALMEISKVTNAASCHCRAVQFELHLPSGLVRPRG